MCLAPNVYFKIFLNTNEDSRSILIAITYPVFCSHPKKAIGLTLLSVLDVISGRHQENNRCH